MNQEPPHVTRWWWIRHAPVPDTVNIYGQNDVDSDTSNRNVFDALARELPRGAAWFTSNLKRTHQTAEAIIEAMIEKDAASESRTSIAERAPGGESFDDLYARVTPAIDRLSTEHFGRDIVAVTHGGTIKAAIGHALKLSTDAALAFAIDNCSITRLDQLRTGSGSLWRVVSINHRPWIGMESIRAASVMA
jgi:broad specificity phosphatase PhoE